MALMSRHIHHQLLDRGLTPRRVVLVLYGLCGLAAAFSLLQSVIHSFAGALLLLFGVFVLLGIQYLGYAEFDLAGRLLFSGEFQRTVSAQLEVTAKPSPAKPRSRDTAGIATDRLVRSR